MGHAVSPNTMRKLLTRLEFSRQANRKADEGSRHPDRNAQFEHTNQKVLAAQAAREPVISVDTKKKELVGNYRNGGTDYRPKGDPWRVKVHDFEDKALGKVAPYGVYDVTADEAWVSVGITADTAQFAVQSSARGFIAWRAPAIPRPGHGYQASAINQGCGRGVEEMKGSLANFLGGVVGLA